MHHIGKRLVERGHDVTVLTSNLIAEKPDKLPDEEVIDGITIKRFRCLPFNPLNKFIFTPFIIPELFSINVDIFHVFSFLPTFIINSTCIVSQYRKKPLIITPTYHPYRSHIYSNFVGKSVKVLYDDLIGIKMLRIADCIIALTESEAQYYRERGIENVHVIPVGVDITEHNSKNSDIKKFRKKFDLDDTCNTILFIGRMERRKGIPFLINSMQSVLKSFPNTKLLFVGSGPDSLEYLLKLRGFNDIQESVILTGYLSQMELSCAYESADVVVIPSIFEAFSHIVIEAWAHKKPVIASKNIGLAEEISSENGELVDYGNNKALSTSILSLLSNKGLAKQKGENGYQLVQEKFRWNKIVTQLEGIYRSQVGIDKDV